ncbi:MAG: T9SS type A sorting domain-containing protein [Bacteroidota bacterium]
MLCTLLSRLTVLLAALLLLPAAAAQDDVFYPFAISASGDQSAVAVALGDDGSAFVAGDFLGSPDFDPGDGETILESAGAFDVFLARYDANGALVWASGIGGSSLEVVGGAATDDDGVVIVGEFTGSFDADPGDGETLLTSLGLSDFFVAKYDAADGALRWAFSIGGTSVDIATDVVATDEGGAVVVGQFNSAADFDPSDGGVVPLISAGGSDAFVAEYDADGAFVRAFNLGGSGEDVASAVAATGAIIAVAGTFSGTVNFDPAGTAEATAPGEALNTFTASYESGSEGTPYAFRWVTPLASEDNNNPGAVAFDGDGNLLVTGRLTGDAALGASALTAQSDFDVFVGKLDPSGASPWAFNIGGFSQGFGIAAAPDGDVVVTGSFFNATDFDPGEGETVLSGVDGAEVFVARYLADGSFRWAFALAAEGQNQGNAVAVDADGSATVVGRFSASKGLDFDPSPDNAITIFSRGGSDAFIAKYDADGAVWEPMLPSNEGALASAGARLSAPYPNPVRSAAQLALGLEEAQHVRVEVFDALGRRVALLHDGSLPVGEHALTLDAAALPSGLYVVRATGDAFALSTRTTVVQ